MKNFGIIHILLLILLFLTYQCASGQDVLVTTQGDTIAGEVKPMFYTVEKNVQIKTNDDKKTFGLLDVKSYRVGNEWFYPIKGPDGYTYMKLLKSGYLSLYAFRSENGNSFDNRYIRKADGDGMEVPNLGFKKQMSKFISECNDVSTLVDQGQYKRNDLEKIIDEYNACIEARTNKVKTEIAVHEAADIKVNALDELEKTISGMSEFEGRATAIEMIGDIKTRITRGERIPNYLIEGLRNTLSSQASLQEPLDSALKEITQ